MVVKRPICADVAALRTLAGCHGNLGRNVTLAACGEFARKGPTQGATVDGIIYLVGLIVIVMAILSFIGIR
jgi:hypothetical protein